MWKKTVPKKTVRRHITMAALLLMGLSLFGCTTGVSKHDAGLADFEAPGIPQNVTYIGKEKAVYLTWSSNTEADLVGYKVYRSSGSGGPFTLIATVALQPSPNYLDNDNQNGLVNDQYYYYKISAFDTQGKESDLSLTNAIQAKAGLDVASKPPRVTNLIARASTTAVYVAWDKISTGSVKGYNIYRGLSSNAGGVTWVAASPVGSPGFVDTSISKASAEQYTYIIRSFNDNYTESENSDPVQVTLKSGDDTIPCPPYNLSVTTDSDPVISWNKPTKNEDGSPIFSGNNPTQDLAAYLIFRANTDDALFNLVGIVEDNGSANLTQSFKDINGSSYNLFAVRAIDSNGNISGLSSVTSQSSDADIPSTPRNLRAWSSEATESGIRLAWDASANASSYNVYFSTVADGGYTKMLTGQPQWSDSSNYVINSYPGSFNQNPDKKGQKLEYGVPYFFKVSAVSSSGKESELSPYAKAYAGSMFTAILEGENPNWEFDDKANDNLSHFYVVNTSTTYNNLDYFSGAGTALLVPTTVGTSGDTFSYGTGSLLSSDYFSLPHPKTTGSTFKYNVYAYYFPHSSGGNWRVDIRENGILSTSLLEKDIASYSPVNKGRTVLPLGQISVDARIPGVDIVITAISAGNGGAANLFLDCLVFVRVQ